MIFLSQKSNVHTAKKKYIFPSKKENGNFEQRKKGQGRRNNGIKKINAVRRGSMPFFFGPALKNVQKGKFSLHKDGN